ncbi:hypothetical protein HK107_12905 [Parvularcula sp. ZS-1/3]|uniref:NarX-like N-terminal domain-containing protein n=1 Tax=Parvularcula mediterranea TaxID=2732508 RepID=A0A7Y3RND2_9PROT|nr:type IV pili methyl-accepting chemotaxis transducer N-terminal domain-containing protein [Parvularcula mediterranea]NNU17224.1 hypothetical protein [Parvularcula mediterranea]
MSASGASLDTAAVSQDGRARINLAGRQRMLSQKMAKASCMIAIDTGAKEALEELRSAHAAFRQVLRGLKDGDPELGLLPERDERVLELLADVEALWLPFSGAVEEVLSQGSAELASLESLGQQSNALLKRMNDAVSLIETVHALGGNVEPVRGRTINVAGRQRMLSQKAAKELCFVKAGQGADVNRKALMQTAATFETSHASLQGGTDGMLQPKGIAAVGLGKVDAIYRGLAPIYTAAIDGSLPTDEEMAKVATQSNRLLREMNRVVYAYTVLD